MSITTVTLCKVLRALGLCIMRASSPIGRVKRVSRERASERRSREGQRKGPWLARSREARFACQIGDLARRLDPLQFFYWEFSAMSQQKSRSLETSHFPQGMGSTKNGWQLCPCKNIMQTQPPIQGLCIHRDSSKCTKHDGYYRHSPGSVDSFNFKSAGLNSNSVRLMKSSASEPGLSLFVPAGNQ